MSTSDSYILSSSSASQDSDTHEIDSLPSSPVSSDFSTSSSLEGRTSDAQKEWEASLQQLELMLTMIIVPYAGKYFGRKFAYWSWAKYMTWMYPVEVRITNKAAFNASGAVSAAATL